jgi:spore coat polysaccharide biosynthesis protein SpsF (cytidylyltransferase family)
MKATAIVQARMSSTRLPRKTLLPLSNQPVLSHIIYRLQNCKNLNDIILATSTDPSDNVIIDWCNKNRIKYFRGSLNDVLDRYYQAAKYYNIKNIVRITSDCPVIDPNIVDEVIQGFFSDQYDVYSLIGEFPDGLDCQVFSFKAISKAWKEAKLLSEREHIGLYMEKNHPELFKIGGLKKFSGLSNFRWTLDEFQDYEFLKEVFSRLYEKDKIFYSKDILELMKKEPNLMKLNSNIVRNEGYLKSLIEDNL